MMRSTLFAYTLLLVALLAWGGYALLIKYVAAERVAYADAALTAKDDAERQENAARLRTSVQGSEVERAALESVVSTTILETAKVVETAGRHAGASGVAIGEATQINAKPPALGGVMMVVNADGSFVSLLRAVSLFETLPVPSQIDHFEITKNENAWRLTARLRIMIAPDE